jgi:DNA-binding transcriptional MocR family regulator
VYTRPAGGYFMWIELPPDFPADAEALLERASDPAQETPVVFTLGNKCKREYSFLLTLGASVTL